MHAGYGERVLLRAAGTALLLARASFRELLLRQYRLCFSLLSRRLVIRTPYAAVSLLFFTLFVVQFWWSESRHGLSLSSGSSCEIASVAHGDLGGINAGGRQDCSRLFRFSARGLLPPSTIVLLSRTLRFRFASFSVLLLLSLSTCSGFCFGKSPSLLFLGLAFL